MTYQVVLSGCGLAVWVWFLSPRLRGRHALPEEPVLPVPWGGVDLLLAAFFFLALMSGARLLMGWMANVEADQPIPYPLQVAGAAVTNGLTVCLMIALAVRFGRRGVTGLGLRSESPAEEVLMGILGFFAVMPALMLFNFILVNVAPVLNYEIRSQQVVTMFRRDRGSAVVAWLALYAVIGAPVTEEVIFRGFAQGYLRKRFSALPAILLSSLVFACFHAPVHVTIAIFLLGLILGYLRERTQSLVAPVVAHVLFNLNTFLTTQIAP